MRLNCLFSWIHLRIKNLECYFEAPLTPKITKYVTEHPKGGCWVGVKTIIGMWLNGEA